MVTLDQAKEAKAEFALLHKFNKMVSGIGLGGTPQTGYTVEARLVYEPSAVERQALPAHITTKSNVIVPVNYQVIGEVRAFSV